MRGQGGETKRRGGGSGRRLLRTEEEKWLGGGRGKECVCMLPCVNGDGDGGGRYTMY